MIGAALYTFVYYLVQILTFAIFARAIISWFPINPSNPLMVILRQVTDPILAPLRRIVPSVGMIDITPMVAIIILQIIATVVERFS